MTDQTPTAATRGKGLTTVMYPPTTPPAPPSPAAPAPIAPATAQAKIVTLLAFPRWDAVPVMNRAQLPSFLRGLPVHQLMATAEQVRPGTDRTTVIELYKAWLAANTGDPAQYAAWFNLGVELAAAGDRANATIAQRNALALKPDLYQAAVNLGLNLEVQGDREGALTTWRNAVQPDEARIMLLNQQGRLLEEMGRFEEAETVLYRSLLTKPDQPDVIQHWSHIRQKMCKWPAFGVPVPGMSEAELMRFAGPLAALSLFNSVTQQRDVAAEWIERKVPAAPRRLSPVEGYAHDRIRVGYLSSDFCMHAMSFLIAELLEKHDRSRFEIYGYCSSREDGSAVRRRIVSAFDHYVPIHTLDDAAAAQRIRQDEIDILVDLNGLTKGARLQTLRWKPAPVQCTYLGYIGPVPMPELDWLICDDFTVPAELRDSYWPRPLPLPDLYQANDSAPFNRPAVSRADQGLPEDRFVFCCFSNYYKITESMFEAWMEILLRTGDSVMWLLADNATAKANMIAKATAMGVATDRLIFAGRVSPDLYRARMALADLFLDTMPYNAGTIASDALRMGLPLLTLSGEPFAARMAGSLLSAIGLPELITRDRDSFIARAVELATDRDFYRGVREKVGGDSWLNTIGNTARFTRNIEAAFEKILIKP